MHHTIKPTPNTIHWGYFDATLKPVATIKSGDTLTISSFSGRERDLPKGGGLEVFDEHRAIIAVTTPQLGPHLLTGPIFIEGAMPGDMLEIRIDAVELIQNWGFNYMRPLAGALPKRFPYERLLHIPIDKAAKTARCPWGTELALAPFFGIMAVAPPPIYGRISTIEPREYGGNMDNKELVAGTTLFLPVFNEGALFSVGDGHGCQGDGEVNVTALETALEGTFTLIVHKRPALPRPRATTPGAIITMAFDRDLDNAADAALSDMIDVLAACAGLSEADAYALCSLACDLRITQVVDGNKGVHAVLKRSLLPPMADAAIGTGGLRS